MSYTVRITKKKNFERPELKASFKGDDLKSCLNFCQEQFEDLWYALDLGLFQTLHTESSFNRQMENYDYCEFWRCKTKEFTYICEVFK